MSQFDDLKERVYQANMELPRLGVVIHNFGNVSAVDRRLACQFFPDVSYDRCRIICFSKIAVKRPPAVAAAGLNTDGSV